MDAEGDKMTRNFGSYERDVAGGRGEVGVCFCSIQTEVLCNQKVFQWKVVFPGLKEDLKFAAFLLAIMTGI